MRKRGIGVLLTGLAFLLMTGCGGPKTPEDVIHRSAAEVLLKSADSYRTETTVNVEFQTSVIGTINAVSTVTTEQTAKPANIHIKNVMDMGAQGRQEMEAYCMEEGDRFLFYLYDGKSWSKEYINPDDKAAKLENLDAMFTNGLVGYDTGLVNMTMTEEASDGKDAYKISADVSGETVSDELKSAVNDLGLTSGDIPFSLDQIPNGKIKFWIEKKTFLPLRATLDMTEMLKDIIDRTVQGTYAQDKIKLTNAVFDCRFYDYNQVGEIKLSDEAASARMK